MERLVKRGASFVMSQELFDDMLCKYMGFEPGTIETRDITTQHYARAIEISVRAYDERFPVLREGERFPMLRPTFEQAKVSDEPLRYEMRFKGFMEMESC